MSKPNIIFILIDDLGWRDLASYGSEFYETPNLDKLAAEGMTFTDAYAACPACSPTRASILTGKTPARLHFEFVTKQEPGHQQINPAPPLRAPPFTLNLPLAEITLAEILRERGYRTAAFMGSYIMNRVGGLHQGIGFRVHRAHTMTVLHEVPDIVTVRKSDG